MVEKSRLIAEPIPKLIRDITVTASVGFLFNTLYNAVDTFFGGLISTQALASLSLSFPVFFIIIAMGTGISTGTTALMANALGAGRRRRPEIVRSMRACNRIQAYTMSRRA